MLTQEDIYEGPFSIFPRPAWRRKYPKFLRKVYFPTRLKQGEFLPTDQIIDTLRMVSKAEGKPVTIIEARPKGRARRMVEKALLVFVVGGFLYFGIHAIAWWAKS